MESVQSFLRFLFIIVVLYIYIVIETKVLIWAAQKLHAYVQYVTSVLEVVHANTVALKLIYPAVVTGVKEGATSNNEGSRLVKTTIQGKKNNKPFKQKAKPIVANEATKRGRLPIPVSNLKLKRSGDERRDSIIDNFRKAEKAVSSSNRTLWPEHTYVTNKKGRSGSRERNNASIENRCSITPRPVAGTFHKTSPKWTRNSQPLYSGFRKQNENTTIRPRSNGWVRVNSQAVEKGPISRKDRLSTSEEKVTSTASSVPCTVYLWSVGTKAETPKEEASNSEIIYAPRTVNNEANLGTAKDENCTRTSNNEINTKTSNISLILIVLAAIMVRLMTKVTQQLCAHIDRLWDLFRDAARRVDRHVIASWFTALWKKVRELYQGPCRHTVGIFYASVVFAFTSIKSKVAAVLSRIRLAFISEAREDQPVSCQDLEDLSPAKDLGGPESTIKNSKWHRITRRTENSSDCKHFMVKAPSYEEKLLRSDKSSRKEKVASAPNSARFALQTCYVEKSEKAPKGKPSNKDAICAPRTVNSSSSRKERSRQNPRSRRRKEQSQSFPNVNQEHESATCDKEQVKEKTTCKRKDRVMPQLFLPSQVNTVAPAKSRVKRKSSSTVGIPKLAARDKSEVSIPRHKEKSPALLEQNVVEDTRVRAKRRHNEEELTYSEKQASAIPISQHGKIMPVPEVPITATRSKPNMKRKAGDLPTTAAKYEPMYVQSVIETDHVATQMSENTTQEQLQLMEVGQSVEKPFFTQPETMEVNTEPVEVEESFEESRAAYYELQTTQSVEPKESYGDVKIENVDEEMESTQEQVSSWNFFPFSLSSFLNKHSTSSSQPAEEDMETGQVQETSWNFFSFSLPSFLKTPFTSQPVEDGMEVVELPILVPTSDEEPKEMDIPQGIETRTPTGQLADAKGAEVPTGNGTPKLVVPSTLSQQRPIRVNHQPLTGCIAATPFGEIADAKRPLASTVGLLKEAVMLAQIPFTEQAITQQVVPQPQMQRPVRQPDSPQLIKSFAHFGASLQPQLNSVVESVHQNLGYVEQPGIKEIATADTTSAYEVRGPTLANQLTMEQLQLVPPADNTTASFADESDSNFDDDSDEEYDLDLETIEKFSELERSPDHAQLITKILMEKESTQWHSISDSDSVGDCGDKCELTQPLDAETIEKYSELEGIFEISPEEAQRLIGWLTKKESS